MAIDLDVIPCSHTSLQWGELKLTIHSMIPDDETGEFIGTGPSLHELRSKRLVKANEILNAPGYYYFEFAKDATLSLALEPNTGEREDIDYFDDFVRNVPEDDKEPLRRRWQQAGFLASVSSYAGRATGELKVMILIARCIAQLTHGYVVVKDSDVFSVPVGIYSSEEFASIFGKDSGYRHT